MCCAGVSANAAQSGALSRGVDEKARSLPGWQTRLTGAGLTKNWEAFKTRNPNTVQQVPSDAFGCCLHDCKAQFSNLET